MANLSTSRPQSLQSTLVMLQSFSRSNPKVRSHLTEETPNGFHAAFASWNFRLPAATGRDSRRSGLLPSHCALRDSLEPVPPNRHLRKANTLSSLMNCPWDEKNWNCKSWQVPMRFGRLPTVKLAPQAVSTATTLEVFAVVELSLPVTDYSWQMIQEAFHYES